MFTLDVKLVRDDIPFLPVHTDAELRTDSMLPPPCKKVCVVPGFKKPCCSSCCGVNPYLPIPAVAETVVGNCDVTAVAELNNPVICVLSSPGIDTDAGICFNTCAAFIGAFTTTLFNLSRLAAEGVKLAKLNPGSKLVAKLDIDDCMLFTCDVNPEMRRFSSAMVAVNPLI